MANTATTTTVVDQSSDAAFRTWIAEVIAQLTGVGITQTADSGQINTSTVTRPAINTSGGYATFRFNDTAQGTSPIFFKIEFGSAGATTTPQMWITQGTGSNGSGTLSGTVGTRVAMTNANAALSTITNYTSVFCYNPTRGVCWMGWKYLAVSGVDDMGGFWLARSNDGTGAVTTDGCTLITNSATATGAASGSGFGQNLCFLNSAVSPATPSIHFSDMPYALTSTLNGTTAQGAPVFQLTPTLQVSANAMMALISEFAIGTTQSVAIVGSTAITVRQAGRFCGNSSLGGNAGAGNGLMALFQ